MVQIQVKGIDAVIQELSAWQRSDLIQRALESLGDAARTEAKGSIEKSRDPDTGAAYTPRKRDRKGETNSKLLIDTGALLREAGEYVATQRTLSIRAGIAYADQHQDGTDTIPQRKFIPISEGWYAPRFNEAVSSEIRSMNL